MAKVKAELLGFSFFNDTSFYFIQGKVLLVVCGGIERHCPANIHNIVEKLPPATKTQKSASSLSCFLSI